MVSLIERDKFIDALFFLFLGMIGGFIGGGIMSCGIQKLVLESIYVKHVIFFVLIYFAIGFVDSNTTDVLSILLSAFVVYFLFMILMKSQKEYVLGAVVLLGGLYVMRKIRESYDPVTDSDKIGFIDTLSAMLTVLIFIVLILGFIIYFRRQYMEHKKDFSLNRFFFGTNKCTHVK